MNWYLALDADHFPQYYNECMSQLYIMRQVIDITESVDPRLADKQTKWLNSFYDHYRAKGGLFPSQTEQ